MKHKYLLLFLYLFFIKSMYSQQIRYDKLSYVQPKYLSYIDNNLILLTSDKKILLLNENDTIWQDFNSNIPDTVNYVTFFQKFKKHFVISTSEGVYTTQTNNKFIWKHHENVGYRSNHIFIFKDSLFLINRDGKQFYFNETKNRFVYKCNLPFKRVTSVIVFKDNLYAASYKEGTWIFKSNNLTWKNFGNLVNGEFIFFLDSTNLYVNANNSYWSYYKLNQNDSLYWSKIKSNEKILLNRNIKLSNSNDIYMSIEYDINDYFQKRKLYYLKDNQILEFDLPENKGIVDIVTFNSKTLVFKTDGIYLIRNIEDKWEKYQYGIYNFPIFKFYSDGQKALILPNNYSQPLFFTNNAGKDWIEINNLDSNLFIDAILIKDEFHIITTTSYITYNSITNKTELISKDDKIDCILKINDSTIIIGKNDGLYKSINYGRTYKKTYEINDKSALNKFHKLIKFNNNILAVWNSKQLIYSVDYGESWKVIKDEPTKAFTASIYKNCLLWYDIYGNASKTFNLKDWIPQQLIFSYFNPFNDFLDNNYYRIINNGDLLISHDYGKTFNKMNNITNKVIKISEFEDKINIVYKNKLEVLDSLSQ